MVLMQSSDLEPGMSCPAFSLMALDGSRYALGDFSGGTALLVAFICNHCPYVRAIEDRLIALRRSFLPRDLEMVGISSNDATNYPDDSTDALLKRWQEKAYGFPYLLDLRQEVAQAFGAVCTPDLFLFDGERRLFYHGQLDDNWQDESQVKSHDLKDAIQAILEGKAPPKLQKPSLGCSIKWL